MKEYLIVHFTVKCNLHHVSMTARLSTIDYLMLLNLWSTILSIPSFFKIHVNEMWMHISLLIILIKSMLAHFADCRRHFWDDLSVTVCHIVSRIGHLEHVGSLSGRGVNWRKRWCMYHFSVHWMDVSCIRISQLDLTTYYFPKCKIAEK